jgi:hypothetical protein
MAAGDIGHVRGGDQHTERIDDDMAFAAADLFAGVVTDLVRWSGVGN